MEAYATIHVAIISSEYQVCLVTIVVWISDVTEQTFAELSLRHWLDAAKIEDLEGFFAGEVTTMGQVTLELLNFLLQVDLIQE